VRDLSYNTIRYEFLHFKKYPHVKYYSNVIVYTKTGTHRVESSDGFLIDDSTPHSGVVYDGTGKSFMKKKSLYGTFILSCYI